MIRRKKNMLGSRLAAFAMTIFLAIGGLPAAPFVAYVQAADSVAYIGADGKEHKCSTYTIIEGSVKNWGGNDESDHWYVVPKGDNTITIDDRVEIRGKVHLILCDGASLEAAKGIRLSTRINGNLTIYGQSQGTGTLEAIGGYSGHQTGNAGIGGDHNPTGRGEDCGELTVCGGKVTAKSEFGGAAIGGGSGRSDQYGGDGGTVTFHS